MKFNVKHLMAVSTVILAMIGAGGAINANNNNVHADDTSDADAMFNNPSIMKDSEEDEKASNESEHEENEAAKPQRKQEAKEEMQNGFLDRDFYKDPTIHHYLRKLGYSNHQMKKDNAVENNDNNNNDVHYGSKAENRLARKARKYSNRHYHKHSKKSVRKHAHHYKKTTKRNRKIRKRVNKRSPKLSYYAQGRKLGKYIHHNKDDNYGGVQYLLNNKKVFNKQFDNGYFKGYTTADPGDDENPAPRARVAFKVANTYQSSHSKAFKQGVRDSFKFYFYGRFNKRYSHNKAYKSGYHYFRSLSAKSSQNW